MGFYRNRMSARAETALDRAKRFRWRIRLLTGVFVAAFLVLCGRAFWLMTLSNERLETLASRQHRQVVELYPKRGLIYDRNGAELARSVEMESIYADPKFVEDPEGTAEALAPLLNIPRARLVSRLTQNLRFVWLGRRLGPDVSETIKNLRRPGIYTVIETQRFYPNRDLGATLLGFTGIDNVGLEGIELAYDEILNGKSSRYVRLRDAKGRNITPEGVLVRQSIDGCHLVLTLDRTLQYEAEKALNESFTKYNAKGGFIIVMDPRTGGILAMTNVPGYNPNAFGKYDRVVYKNQAVVNCFEPGSTQKCFLVASALNDGVIRPDEKIDCENGRYKIGRRTVHDTHEYGELTIGEVIKLSSNIGAAKIADRLGKDRLYSYYRAFGFGEPSRSGLPGEIGGILRHPRSWSRIGLATHGFGQGMSVTGLQIASGLSTIANGGVRMKPYIIKAVKDQTGKTLEENEPQEVARVLSEEVANKVAGYMRAVTEEGGTGTRAAIKGYTTAGKTGTAQKVNPETRRYGKGMYTSSFVGFVPAEDPRLVIVVVLDEPHGNGYYGGTVSAPAFAQVAQAGMRYLGIPPSVVEEPDPKKNNQVSLVAKVTTPAEGSTDGPKVIERPALTPVLTDDETGTDTYILPDFTGQTMRSILSALEDKSLALKINGTGVAVSQTPEAGATIKSGETLLVAFVPEAVAVSGKKGAHR